MSFSSRRRNYFLTPHRRDGLIEWMKSMLMHSFVLDALATTGADTFSHFEELVNEHREICMADENNAIGGNIGSNSGSNNPTDQERRQSRLKRLVPTVGVFHTPLPLRRAYEAYNARYKLDKRRHLAISFNEIRHILNLAQIMALRKNDDEAEGHNNNNNNNNQSPPYRFSNNPLDSPALVALKGCSNKAANEIPDFSLDGGTAAATNQSTSNDSAPSDDDEGVFNGPSMITFDGDQTLYSDGANFESNPRLATFLYLLLRKGVTVAVVTAAGYEYQTAKYELRLSGLLQFFKQRQPLLTEEQLNRFYLFGGECNYLLRLGSDYKLHPVREHGAGGWMTSTRYLGLDSPANWPEDDITRLLDLAEKSLKTSIDDQNLKGARFIRKKRSVGLVPAGGEAAPIPREALDETVLRVQDDLDKMVRESSSRKSSLSSSQAKLPYCAFNGGRDVWVDVGNKRVGVQILQSYLGVPAAETLHIGDQFLNTGNDYAARQTCPCIWITSPDETTYILKSILRLAGVVPNRHTRNGSGSVLLAEASSGNKGSNVDFAELERRTNVVATMDVFTGELIPPAKPAVSAASVLSNTK
mmetsp:Transcript_22648/g.48010  ORF Transcript_22648/g.48010 Transcript_22648/m.48010 type:complete len:585 (+) Transcript_22648:234-1988(+)